MPPAQATTSPALARKSITSDTQFSNSPELQFDSPLTTGSIASMPSPNSAPYEWYDLLAEDAIQNVAKYNLNLEVEKPRLSREIVSTAILISTYEMFDAEGQYNNGAWERHLRGIFWIQRSQNNNGWSKMNAKIPFDKQHATESVMKYDVETRVDQGKKLTQALKDWYNILGSSFQPIYRPLQQSQDTFYSPIWIHPPSHAAAIQTYHFSRIIVAINEPSPGGMDDMRHRQRLLDESVETICGIASTQQGRELPSAMINVRALYAAGLAARDPIKQAGVLQLLERTLEVTKFPPKSILHDLTTHWQAQQ
ncbi:hypothetical protein E8E11_005196 [Didymella keratinophila]|nr:hypothetical protein E8E11_005196 [Didymella keratinophila]